MSMGPMEDTITSWTPVDAQVTSTCGATFRAQELKHDVVAWLDRGAVYKSVPREMAGATLFSSTQRLSNTNFVIDAPAGSTVYIFSEEFHDGGFPFLGWSEVDAGEFCWAGAGEDAMKWAMCVWTSQHDGTTLRVAIHDILVGGIAIQAPASVAQKAGDIQLKPPMNTFLDMTSYVNIDKVLPKYAEAVLQVNDTQFLQLSPLFIDTLLELTPGNIKFDQIPTHVSLLMAILPTFSPDTQEHLWLVLQTVVDEQRIGEPSQVPLRNVCDSCGASLFMQKVRDSDTTWAQVQSDDNEVVGHSDHVRFVACGACGRRTCVTGHTKEDGQEAGSLTVPNFAAAVRAAASAQEDGMQRFENFFRTEIMAAVTSGVDAKLIQQKVATRSLDILDVVQLHEIFSLLELVVALQTGTMASGEMAQEFAQAMAGIRQIGENAREELMQAFRVSFDEICAARVPSNAEQFYEGGGDKECDAEEGGVAKGKSSEQQNAAGEAIPTATFAEFLAKANQQEDSEDDGHKVAQMECSGASQSTVTSNEDVFGDSSVVYDATHMAAPSVQTMVLAADLLF